MESIDEAGNTQESSRRRPWPLRRARPQRGQAASQSGQWSQGWLGQKRQENAGGAAQRPATAARPREEVLDTLIATIRARFGEVSIGRGARGIRFPRVRYAHTA